MNNYGPYDYNRARSISRRILRNLSAHFDDYCFNGSLTILVGQNYTSGLQIF